MNSSHSWVTRGMLTTRTFVFGEPAVSVFIAAVNWAPKSATEGIWATVSVHRSLPPTSTVR